MNYKPHTNQACHAYPLFLFPSTDCQAHRQEQAHPTNQSKPSQPTKASPANQPKQAHPTNQTTQIRDQLTITTEHFNSLQELQAQY